LKTAGSNSAVNPIIFLTIRYLLKVKEKRRKTAFGSLQDPPGRCITEIKHKLQRPSLEIPLSARNTLLTVPLFKNSIVSKWTSIPRHSSHSSSLYSQKTSISSVKDSNSPLIYRGKPNAASKTNSMIQSRVRWTRRCPCSPIQ